MKIEQLLENEKEALLDYLFNGLDSPLESANEDLKNLFQNTDLDEQDIRFILKENYLNSHFCSTVPGSNEIGSIRLNIGEIEIPTDEIDPEEIDEFTINGSYAYYYIGYGFMVYFDADGIKQDIKDRIK